MSLALDAAVPLRPHARATAREQGRRLKPRITDTDWLVLSGMRREIAAMAARVARPGMTALDFGCGARPYQAVFAAQGASYQGADLGPEAEVRITDDGRLLAPDGAAYLLLSFQVLEHVRDLSLYFREARRTLRPDGLMILSTHGTWLYHAHPEDHRRWTRQGLVSEIEANGFEVVDCVPIVGPLAWTVLVRLTCAAFALRRIPAVGPALAGALAAVTNLRAWLEDAVTPKWVSADNACVYLTLSRPKAAR